MIILVAFASSLFTVILVRSTDNKAFAAKPVKLNGTLSNLEVYWNTYDPILDSNEFKQQSLDMNCPTGMVAVSAGGKFSYGPLNIFPFGPLITDTVNTSGASTDPTAVGWRIQLPDGQPFTTPVIGYVVCAKVN